MATTTFNSFYQPTTIIVNGVQMSVKEFNAMRRKKNAAKRKKATKETSVTILPEQIKEMLKNVKVLKSIVAYYEHGYRQWGTIARMLMNLKSIKTPFFNVTLRTKEAISLVNKIETLARKDTKDTFQYVTKLGWKLEDVRKELDSLTKGVTESGCMHQFRNHECINGIGRRLGLQILVQRGRKAVDELDYICSQLITIGDNGADVFEYHGNGKRMVR